MGRCGPQWIPQEWREHSYDSGRTWSSLLGAARTPVLDSHDLKAMNIRQMCISKLIYITQSYLPLNIIINVIHNLSCKPAKALTADHLMVLKNRDNFTFIHVTKDVLGRTFGIYSPTVATQLHNAAN
jgi:hypothetical protein